MTMEDDDEKYRRYASIPIPTYDEATSSRPGSSQQFRGPEEISDDSERQGLLNEGHGAYQPPTVESARSSVDSDLQLPEVDGEEYDRRQVEELDYLDPVDTSRRSPRLYHRARLRSKFTQRLSDLSATLSSLRLPSFRSLYISVPAADQSDDTEPSTSSYLTRLSQRIHISDRYRMSAPTAARLCGLLTIGLLIYILFAMNIFPTGPGGRLGNGMVHFDPESVRVFVQDTVLNSGDRMQEYLRHITSFDHVAGTEGDLYLAKWVEGLFRGGDEASGGPFGGSHGPSAFDDVTTLPYNVYLNYPRPEGRSVKIVRPETMQWNAALDEEQVIPDEQQTLAWHGYSKTGQAEGHLIFAHEGRREDFQYLHSKGVVTNGSIALIKSFSTPATNAVSLGSQIKAAEAAGCVGALVYSDSTYNPPKDSLRRGSASLSNIILGDPLTPGFASTLEATRFSREENPALPQIPSLPLSWRDAEHLLATLKDGKAGIEIPRMWAVNPNEAPDGQRWWTGNVSASNGGSEVPIVHLQNQNDENTVQQIWNVHGSVFGFEALDQTVVVGSHRDSFCFGAVNPGSGTAILLELANVFSELRKLGWEPLRTLHFVSWDAGEWGNTGSTEYVEEHLDLMRNEAVAYLNVDAGVWGPGQTFRAEGSPVWQRSLLHVLDRVGDPNANASLRQLWEQRSAKLTDPPTVDSDTLPWQMLAGTSSVNIGFGGKDGKTYPRGSCYEAFNWMKEYGDRDFTYHKALAQVWALLILEIVDRPLLPFDLNVYAERIKEGIGATERLAAAIYADANNLQHASIADVQAKTKLTFQPLKDAADLMAKNVVTFHSFEDTWTSNVFGSGGLETMHYRTERLKYNVRLARFETDLLDLAPTEGCPHGGMPGRCQYKHTVYGPSASGGSGMFPGVVDALEAGDWKLAMKMVERAAKRIRVASEALLAE